MQEIALKTVLGSASSLSPADVMKQVHNLFSSIGSMNADQAIAAFQTVSFFKKGAGRFSKEKKYLESVEEALLVQMKTILDRRQGMSSAEYINLRHRFARATSRDYWAMAL